MYISDEELNKYYLSAGHHIKVGRVMRADSESLEIYLSNIHARVSSNI